MKEEKVCKITGVGTGVSLAFSFGLLKFILIASGFTALGVLNYYGDFLFLPLFSFFSVIFIWSLHETRNAFFYFFIMAIIAVAAYFASFGMTYAGLIVGGSLLGVLSINWLKTN